MQHMAYNDCSQPSRRRHVLQKTSFVLVVLFILMIAATICFEGIPFGQRFAEYKIQWLRRSLKSTGAIAHAPNLAQPQAVPDGWLDDGSGTIVGDGLTVSCTAEVHADAVFHALWTGNGSASTGTHYWEIENTRGLGAVGMTTLSKFGKGYSSRSFDFNSINLSDGNRLLVASYGNRPFQDGDKVGILCQMTDAALIITFYLNGRCLGPAFHVASPYPTELYPVVTFRNGDSRAAIKKCDSLPQARTREADPKPFPEGLWKLSDSESVPVTLNVVSVGNGVYWATLSVVNHCKVQLMHEADAWTSSMGMMTMMMGPKDAMDVEQACVQKLQHLTNLQDLNGQLLISSPLGSLIFDSTFIQLPIPYTQNVLI